MSGPANGPGACGVGELDHWEGGIPLLSVWREGPQCLAERVPALSLPSALESIFTSVLCVSLAGRRVDFRAEDYTTLDSHNLLNTKRPEAAVALWVERNF